MKKLFLFAVSAILAFPYSNAYGADNENIWVEKIIEQPQPEKMRKAGEADNGLVFGYSGDVNKALGTGQAKVSLKAAIEIPENIASSWKGDQVSKVRIGFGQSSNSTITIFISETLTGEPVYQQTAYISTQNGWNEFELTTPYDINGKGFFIGYESVTRATTDYPLGADGVPTTQSYGDYIALNDQWQNIGSSYGNVCIKIVVTGDNLPKNDVAVTEVVADNYVKPGSTFSATATFVNHGLNPVTALSVTCSVDGKQVANPSVKITPATVASGQTGKVVISGLTCDRVGQNIPLSVTVDKVNGQNDDTPANNTASTSIICLENGFQRHVVVEEWTGTWCGWCVRGIVGMKYMNENYGDKGFIGIAVHGEDVMQVNSYVPFLNKYAEGYPGCIADRTEDFDPNKSELLAYYQKMINKPALAEVKLDAEYSEDKPKDINVDATVKFVFPSDGQKYSLAFVVTEDHVGPASQYNYYSGGSYGAMDGWEKESSRVSTYFNEVARIIVDCWGISNSLPSSVEGNKEYTYSTTISATNITNINNCSVVALLLDGVTGQIVNADKVSFTSDASVSDALADGVSVFTVPGAVVINGDYRDATVYGIDGSVITTATGVGSIELPSGLYIVKVVDVNNMVVTQKVCVK